MEILLGALVALLAQVTKKVSAKLGADMAKIVILVFVFTLTFVFSWAVQGKLISMETIDFMLKTFSASIAIYEVVYKRMPLKLFPPAERVDGMPDDRV